MAKDKNNEMQCVSHLMLEFLSILYFVCSSQKKGFEVGFDEGKAQGWREGFLIGAQKSCEIGTEVINYTTLN